ncbi:DNA-binding response OmpR family regulator [Tumebacillus sp. BK434]|uniref:response regulator transcription factor n=1 Tax=Tumebacillus sp. BK434 TaxID=2512169 RepID=UPI00104381D2|nr:response regulator transcription factor [Tumebacillus sp. BK434]TCP53688.1 DNA-binding response OmpR family regulator [Tumebacillus sp. BK434]
MKVLIVEDDASLLKAVADVFEEEGYQTDRADNGLDGLLYAGQGIYDLLVLDIMLPGKTGLEIIKALRKAGSTAPILLLTARDSVEDRVKGLDAGADDYLTKPFAFQELLARARALLRRKGGVSESGEVVCGPLVLKAKEFDAFVEGAPLKLTAKEYKLLEFLLLNRGQILTKEQIFDRVWGFDVDTNMGVVDVYLHYVRKKLALQNCDGLIHTVRGVGYMLKEIG